MKHVASLLLLGSLAACGTASPTGHQASNSATVATAPAAKHTATLKIEGMTCGACSVTVETAAGKLDGLVSIDVDVEAGQATAVYDSGKLSAEQIAERITTTGYKATVASDRAA